MFPYHRSRYLQMAVQLHSQYVRRITCQQVLIQSRLQSQLSLIHIYRMNLTGPIGLVIGNEGEGVSRLVKEACDFTASIPMKGDIDSLNASVAAGVLAYEIVRQRLASESK